MSSFISIVKTIVKGNSNRTKSLMEAQKLIKIIFISWMLN